MPEILGNIYIWVFLLNIEGVLRLTLKLNICCVTILLTTVFFWYLLEARSACFVVKNCWKSTYICVFILSQKRHNWFHKNLHNSGMVDRRKLPDLLLNRIFNALSIGIQYTLSFQWTNFGLKCLANNNNNKNNNNDNNNSNKYNIIIIYKYNNNINISLVQTES